MPAVEHADAVAVAHEVDVHRLGGKPPRTTQTPSATCSGSDGQAAPEPRAGVEAPGHARARPPSPAAAAAPIWRASDIAVHVGVVADDQPVARPSDVDALERRPARRSARCPGSCPARRRSRGARQRTAQRSSWAVVSSDLEARSRGTRRTARRSSARTPSGAVGRAEPWTVDARPARQQATAASRRARRRREVARATRLVSLVWWTSVAIVGSRPVGARAALYA